MIKINKIGGITLLDSVGLIEIKNPHIRVDMGGKI